jgi:alanine-synthesizing transaminase
MSGVCMEQFQRINRLPPYVFSIMDNIKHEILAAGAEIFDFGIGNPDQPTAPHIVEALRDAVLDPTSHGYAAPRGTIELRQAISRWYGRRYGVELDPETEALITLGSKEGLTHLAIALVGQGDTVLVPNPCYPAHHFGFVIADGNVQHITTSADVDFFAAMETAMQECWPKPKVLVLNFPSNPTTECVDLAFFTKVIEIAKRHKIWVVHDLAYADIVFDDYKAPSILQVTGAKDIAVESYTLSKSYNMAGWRVGFMCGNPKLLNALLRVKSYVDYGYFIPIQKAAVAALDGPQECVEQNRRLYQKRRDFMCAGLNAIGWKVTPPKATMFLWAPIPEKFHALGSLEFSKLLLREAHVVVTAGIAFGEFGNQYVRISLTQDESRMTQALKNIAKVLSKNVSDFNLVYTEAVS